MPESSDDKILMHCISHFCFSSFSFLINTWFGVPALPRFSDFNQRMSFQLNMVLSVTGFIM